MSKKFDEQEERIMNERSWGLGLAFAVTTAAIVIGVIGRGLGYW